MNIFILISGSSSRFYKENFNKPKFLINVKGKLIIEHIISNFDKQNDFYYFICREDFYYNKKLNIEKIIKKNCKNFKILLIKKHNFGPVYSLLKYSNLIKKLNNVIINYCDFNWVWNYYAFKRWLILKQAQCAAVCYKGFHPHYINSLMFAYVKSKNNKILKVKEKESFTNNRENEPAMSGTFFFKSGEILIKACNQIIDSKDLVNNEYYVSLLFNYILDKNKFVYLIDYFFQWGTPKDLNQYLNWQDNINFNQKINIKNFTNVIMMAGKGKRMKNFNRKKPYIELNNKMRMYEYLNSNIISKKKVCLINGDHEDEKYLNKNEYVTFKVNNTNNQIDTIYKYLSEYKKNSSNFFISPCDAKIYFNIESLNQLIRKNKNFAMIIFTYDKYDFAKEKPNEFGWLSLKKNRNIKSFLHKPKKIKGDEELITGFFLINKNLPSAELIEKFKKKNKNKHLELSLDLFSQYLHDNKYSVQTLKVNNFLCLGTQKEFEIFNYWQKAHEEINS